MLWKPQENRSTKEIQQRFKKDSFYLWVIRAKSARGKKILAVCTKNKCGDGQPPSPHRSWISRPAIPPLGRRADGTGPTALTSECHFYQYSCRARFGESFLCNLCGGQQPNPLRRAGSGGGRNARATGTHSRAFPNPWQFTLENRQLPPASPQSSFGKR
jgi:hypothetical protein